MTQPHLSRCIKTGTSVGLKGDMYNCCVCLPFQNNGIGLDLANNGIGLDLANNGIGLDLAKYPHRQANVHMCRVAHLCKEL